MAPPISDRYQNWIGMWLSRRRSDEIHCTMKRAAKTNWPPKPMRTQKSQVRGSRLTGFSQNAECRMQNADRRSQFCILHSAFCISSIQFLPNLVAQHPLPHPPHGQAIRQSSEGAIHRPVLRDAEAAGAVIDGHLGHFVSSHPHQGGEEAMHAGVEADALDCFATHQLERAAGVGDLIA